MTDTTRDLVSRLVELLRRERETMAEFIATLAGFDRQRRWAELGYPTLYDFLVRELRMSKGTAFYRKVAVELVQRYPEVLDALRRGDICITAVHALSKAITPENLAETLPRFFHVSTREAKVVAAELAPASHVPRREVVTVVRLPPVVEADRTSQALGNPAEAASTAALSLTAPSQPTPLLIPAPRSGIEPLTATERRLFITVTPGFLEMLDACKDALSHVMPGADAAAVFQEGMKLILVKDAKKNALVAKPRPRKNPELPYVDSRDLPAELRREVWTRDEGRCQWQMPGGGICGSTFQPEIDHIHGFKPGEPIAAKDLRVCCKPHNLEHEREVYGDAFVDQFRRTCPRRGRRGRRAA